MAKPDDAGGREKFPRGTHLTRPEGGYFLWIEMPEQVNALDVYRLARERKITTVPGQIFSPQPKFENCIRLNYSHAWTPKTEAAVTTLGGIVTSLT